MNFHTSPCNRSYKLCQVQGVSSGCRLELDAAGTSLSLGNRKAVWCQRTWRCGWLIGIFLLAMLVISEMSLCALLCQKERDFWFTSEPSSTWWNNACFVSGWYMCTLSRNRRLLTANCTAITTFLSRCTFLHFVFVIYVCPTLWTYIGRWSIIIWLKPQSNGESNECGHCRNGRMLQ